MIYALEIIMRLTSIANGRLIINYTIDNVFMFITETKPTISCIIPSAVTHQFDVGKIKYDIT